MENIGLHSTVLKLMKDDPEILYNVDELVEAFKNTEYLNKKNDKQQFKAIDNILRKARLDGVVSRHIDRDADNKTQYAVKIPKNKIAEYIPSSRLVRKKQTNIVTSKEIRSMFAAQYNYLAKLEDVCMSVIEKSEMTEKELDKIKSFLIKK